MISRLSLLALTVLLTTQSWAVEAVSPQADVGTPSVTVSSQNDDAALEARRRRGGKPFRRVLVMAGGSISPGFGLGLLAGVEHAGWVPDVIIATCGTSIAASIENAYGNTVDALAYERSQTFMDVMRNVHIETENVLQIQRKFSAAAHGHGIPPIFERNILSLSNNLNARLPNNRFSRASGGPRVVIVAARAHFGPSDVGHEISGPRFTETFFTDPSTGAALRGLPSPVNAMFPHHTFLAPNTNVVTDVTAEQAMRASISDPFLINPGRIGDDYYFTGAVDLYPIEVAQALGDDVVVTYPQQLFQPIENLAIATTFGFTQNARALSAIQHHDVKWIDITGLNDVTWQPRPHHFIHLQNTIPTTLPEFQAGIQRQYDFGFERGAEAIRVQRTQNDVRTHLRKPINPLLAQAFTCENANEWATDTRSHCTSDRPTGCDRRTEETCTPVR